MGTGAIVLTFCIGASLVSSLLVKCGKGLEAMVRLVLRQSSSFNWANVRLGRALCSADNNRWMDISVSVQSGAGASSVVRICFSPQVTTTGRDGPPSSEVEITLTWSSVSRKSVEFVPGAYHAAFTCSSVATLSGIVQSDATWPVWPQLTQNADVPCSGRVAGITSSFMPRGFDGHTHSPARFVRHELTACCTGFRARSFKGQSATKCEGSPQLKHVRCGCCLKAAGCCGRCWAAGACGAGACIWFCWFAATGGCCCCCCGAG